MAQFPSMLAQDATGVLSAGLVGQVFDVTDVLMTTPLDIFTKTGAAFAGNQLVSGPNGVLPEFSCPGRVVVRWKSGSYIMDIVAMDQVPTGGLIGQVLAKTSNAPYDLKWSDSLTLPSGGLAGQFLKKNSTTDYDALWADLPVAPAGGGALGINVKSFGATGNGTTDDAAAIQAALDAVPASGGMVWFPAGDYAVGTNLFVRTEGTMLAGEGAANRTGATQASIGSRIKAKTGLTGALITVQRVADDRPLQGVHFRDLTIDGALVGTLVDGVVFRSNQGSMVNVHIWNFTGVGLRVKGYQTPAVWDTYDSRFLNCLIGYNAVAGVFLDLGAADTMWSNCVLLENYDNLVIKGSSPQFSNCHFYTPGRRDIWFDGNGSRGKFSNCKIEGAKDHMVYIDTTNGGYSDVQFTGCGFSSLNQTVLTNTFDYVHITGPSGNGASRFTFVGNSFNLKGGGTVKARYAINLTGSAVQNAVIMANSFGPASHWGTAPLNQASNSALLQFVRGNWGLPDLVFENVQTVSYTAVVADTEVVIAMDSATAVNLTIPPNAQPGFQKGNVLKVLQKGLGQVTLVPGAGVTIRTPRTLTTRAQWSEVTLRQRISNEWVVEGDLT